MKTYFDPPLNQVTICMAVKNTNIIEKCRTLLHTHCPDERMWSARWPVCGPQPPYPVPGWAAGTPPSLLWGA